MKYQRLKSIDGSGTITRYFELDADEAAAYANAFYGITSGKAKKLDGALDAETLVGFSHGGGNVVEGCILLDINPNVVYMGILEELDTGRPAIGEVVFGYQKVIDTHYDGDAGVAGKGTNGAEFGVETLNNPYYLFTIVQPEGSAFDGTVDDGDAGEISGGNFPAYPKGE
jgi:hypothetical protein